MSNATPHARRTYVWWVILCLVGLDYFSSLAYLPSIAVSLLGDKGDLAPIAGLAVVLVTLLAAIPVYWYVVGRSPHGEGGVGLLERCFHGWRGKLLVLILLGFIATDFVLTRALSTSDASAHILNNPGYREFAAGVKQDPEKIRQALPGFLQGGFFDFWNEQLLLTVGLTILAFSLYFFLVTTLSRGFVSFAVGVVALYVLLNVLLVGSGMYFLFATPEGRSLVQGWEERIRPELGDIRIETGGPILMILKLALLSFPAMAIGLSGFEMSMASAPLVEGASTDTPSNPAGRIRRTRLLMLVAASVMSVLVISSIFVVTLLIYQERAEGGRWIPPAAMHRSLAYLAHGERLVNDLPATAVFPFAGRFFGTLYDVSAILILILAGASATISMKDIVPDFLARFGMQMVWAHKVGVITHLFNITILLVTVAFQASVANLQWAYAAAVLALLFGASLAATLDVRQRLHDSGWHWPASLPFLLITTLFAAMGALIVWQNPVGVAIALSFGLVVLVTAIVSRWVRSTELRFDGFEFATPDCEHRWGEISKLDFQILVPHDPKGSTLRHKEDEIRRRHRLASHIPVIFVEVSLGDTSDFHQKPLMRIDREGNEDVIRVSRCISISHVLAAIGLAFREVGVPPELHFGWSDESPLAANLNFVLLGQGNVPWMVQALIRKEEKDPERRPRVIIG